MRKPLPGWLIMFCLVVLWFGWMMNGIGQNKHIRSQQAQIDSLKVEAEYEWLNSMQGEINALRYTIDSIAHQHPIDLTAARQRAVEL